MLTKSPLLSFSMLAFFCMTQNLPALAQSTVPTNWETNQQNAINQDASSGALNSSQVSALQNRETQIQAQQQQYMNQNGGSLTPQQQQQIDSELHGVNKHLNRDVRYDAAQNTSSGAPAFAPSWQNGSSAQGQWPHPQWQANPQQQQWQSSNQQWQNGNQQWQNAHWQNPQQWQNANPQQWQSQQNSNPQQWQSQQSGNLQQNGNPQQWQQHNQNHHHHNGGGGNGYAGGNGYGGGNGYSNGSGWHN